MDEKKTNPNDFKVVEFFNSTNFDFTPELGAMYDGRPLFVGSGERRQFPYHVGHRLAINLAKAVLIKGAPLHDPNSRDPVGKPLWGEDGLKQMANSFIKEMFMDETPIVQSETDRLMARVNELEKLFKEKQRDIPMEAPKEKVMTVEEMVNTDFSGKEAPKEESEAPKVYLDKQEVIAELEKRGIKHDKRSNKETLEKLLA
jgi:hypothetical protein